MTVLEGSESLRFSVPHTQNQITGSSLGLQSMDGIIQRVVELQYISEDEREGYTDSAFLAEGVIGVGHTDLANSQSLLRNTGD